MDPKELRGLMEAYSEVYAPEQLDEISQKTATRAFAQRATDDYELDNTARTKSGESKADETKRRIERKFGKKAGAHAERAAHANTFGRGKEGFTKMPPKPTNEELDIFDVVLEFLQVEGYAETLEEAEWMMANLIDEEAVAIILGEEQLDEASRRDEFTRAAISRSSGRKGGVTFEPGPNWDASANRGKGAHISPKQKEKQRRKALRQENFELWVNELVEEGYDLSDYTWDEMYEFYLDEAIYSEKGKAKAAEMIAKRSTPSGRAKSGKGANVAQIRQIRGSGRGRFDREGLGGTPMTPTMAKNPIKKQNYDGTGNKAARRAGLTPTREKPNAWKEDFELWVNELVEEGYDLSDYTWDEMYDIYEAEKPFPYEKVTAQQKKHTAAGRYGNMMKMGLAKRRAKEAEKTGGSQRDAGKGWYHAKEAFEAWLDEAMSSYDKNRKRAAQRAAARNDARAQGKTGAVPGVGYVTPRKERETWTDESGKTRHAKGL